MAKIVKTQEVELGLEELITLIKKNWDYLLANCFAYEFLNGKVTIRASINLTVMNRILNQISDLVADENELNDALVKIFREIASQKPHLEVVEMCRRAPNVLDAFFAVDTEIAPAKFIDPIDIPGPDNPVLFQSAR